MKKMAVTGVLGTIFLVIIPLFMVLLLFGSTMTAASKEMATDYVKAAESVYTSWQNLLAFDTVRYENDFSLANPSVTALEFAIIDYEKYTFVKKQGKGTWVLTSSGRLGTKEEISDYFSLKENEGMIEVQDKISKYESPRPWSFSVSSKRLEEVMKEHNFTKEQIEHAVVLIDEDILTQQFMDTLPDSFLVSIGDGYFIWPMPTVPPKNIYFAANQRFGKRWHPVDKVYKYHDGLDFGVPVGTPVVALEDGVVSVAGFYPAPGNYIVLKFTKDKKNFLIQYMHLSSISVKVGDKVKKGQIIGKTGNTGKSTGPHLHLGIMINGQYVNPMDFIMQKEEVKRE